METFCRKLDFSHILQKESHELSILQLYDFVQAMVELLITLVYKVAGL